MSELKSNKRFANREKAETASPSIKDVNLTEDAVALAGSTRERPMPVIEPIQERIGAGRPKVQKKIERNKAMNVHFDLETHKLLKNMKFYHEIEMKDIPYVLTREFFKKYEAGGKLSDEGLAYIQRLLSEVN